jgi:hypothetical protein
VGLDQGLMDADPVVRVTCTADGTGWRCHVTVGDDAAATTHRVSIEAVDLQRFAPPGTSPEHLVEASFEFLLQREPREFILRAFELPVIGRYFPEYEAEIRRRLGD